MISGRVRGQLRRTANIRLIPTRRELRCHARLSTGARRAHPHSQGAQTEERRKDYPQDGSSPLAGSSDFLTRDNTHKQPENIQFPCCIEMSRQFLAYGGHTLNEGLGLDASPLPIYRLAVRGVPIDGLWGSTSI